MQNLEKTEALASLAFWGFIILYPMFFWYHALLYYGAVPEVIYDMLRGWYGPASVFFLSIFALNFHHLFRNTKIKKDWIFIVFFCYVLWSIFWSLAHVLFNPKDYTIEGATKLCLSLALQTSNFIIGSLLILLNKDKKTLVLFFAWLSISIFCIVVYEPHHGSVFHSLTRNAELNIVRIVEMQGSSYQGLARSFLMTSLLLIALIEVRLLRYLACIVSTITLALIGARSELLGLVCAISIFEITKTRLDSFNRGTLLIALISLTLASIAFVIWLGEHVDQIRSFRLFNLGSDPSVTSRLNQIIDAINVIIERPLVGNFAVHLKTGNHGDIPHNIFSAWTMLGLPGFLLISSMVAGSCYAIFRATFITKNLDATWNHSLLLAAMACPLLLISKSAFVEWLPLLFGSVVAARTLAPELTRASDFKD